MGNSRDFPTLFIFKDRKTNLLIVACKTPEKLFLTQEKEAEKRRRAANKAAKITITSGAYLNSTVELSATNRWFEDAQ
jgi:hypothetical protein